MRSEINCHVCPGNFVLKIAVANPTFSRAGLPRAKK
jgi:hypothetical protein